MITQDRIYQLALRAGCEPKFYDGALGPRWHCGCPDLRHAMDQQCPVLTEEVLYPGPTRAHGLYYSWLETGIDRRDREVMVDTERDVVYLTPDSARKLAYSLLGLADEVENLR